MSWWVHHWIPESNEDRWSMITTTICWDGYMQCLLFWWHILWQLGKVLNNQHGNTNKKYYTNISRHRQPTNKNIIQKTRVYNWSLKSNTKLSPRHLRWSRHCERPRSLKGALKKRFKCLGHLSFGVIVSSRHLFFIQKKMKNENTITCPKIPRMLLIDSGNTITSW